VATGAEARLGHHEPVTGSQRAWEALDGLAQRQAALPDLMRAAAKQGDWEQVARLRLEWDQMPSRVWAVTYTAVHQELEEHSPVGGHRDRHDLEERAARLAQEVRRR
jgi:hypothetical protein